MPLDIDLAIAFASALAIGASLLLKVLGRLIA